MGLTKPNQELARDLQGLASDFKLSAVELMRIAERLSLAGNEMDAQAVLKMCTVFHAGEDKLARYADEVKAGRLLERNAHGLWKKSKSRQTTNSNHGRPTL
ncbi:hypothetical protein [Pseudomonas syringae]|uniref:hypothetical protein n=1 Tax=Pseudomonas syringae TaxID=317 RepID=UPI001E39D648|nr:hypothetical protein [Pseudomonas syringae]